MELELLCVLEDGSGPRSLLVPENPRTPLDMPLGSDVALVTRLVRANGQVVTGGTLRWTAKKKPTDTQVAFFKQTALLDPTTFSVTPQDTKDLSPGVYCYDLWYTDEQGNQNNVMPLSPLHLEPVAVNIVPVVTLLHAAPASIVMLKDQQRFVDVTRTIGSGAPEEVSNLVLWTVGSGNPPAASVAFDNTFAQSTVESHAVGSASLVASLGGKSVTVPVVVQATPHSLIITDNDAAPSGNLDVVSVDTIFNGTLFLHLGFSSTSPPLTPGTHTADFEIYQPSGFVWINGSIPFDASLGETAWYALDVFFIHQFAIYGEWSVRWWIDGVTDVDHAVLFRRFTLQA